jgi:hypothetical protein
VSGNGVVLEFYGGGERSESGIGAPLVVRINPPRMLLRWVETGGSLWKQPAEEKSPTGGTRSSASDYSKFRELAVSGEDDRPTSQFNDDPTLRCQSCLYVSLR